MPIIVDNKIIETPVKNILQYLKQQVDLSGIQKLKFIDFSTTEAKVTCPIHKGGREEKPSCFITLADKGNVVAGTAHCFACGYSTDIVGFISACLGISRANAKTWLLGFCNYSLTESSRFVPTLDVGVKTVSNNYDTLPIITQEELNRYEYIHPYMFERKLTAEVIQQFDVGYDPIMDALTFPVYVNGKCLFVAKRSVHKKMFYMPKIEPKPIYGLDYLTGNEVIVCESVINALTCWAYGKQAVALFGLGSDYQIEVLKSIPQRKVVIGLDGDEYGRGASYKIMKALKDIKMVSRLDVPYGKDINDLSYYEFKNLKEIF